MTWAALILIAALVGGGWLWAPDKERAELEARYAGPPSIFIEVEGLRLHVRDTGPVNRPDAPVLILLHGFASSLHIWEPWAQALESDFRVIRFDLPGSGLTGADPTGDYSDERAIQIIGALMDRLGVAHATFIGHSMGGRIAWRFAAAQPQRVDKLVLLAPDGYASPGFEYGKPPAVPLFAQLMRWLLPKAVLRKSLEPAYADAAQMTDERVDRTYDMLLAPQVREALLARMAQLNLQEPTPFLRRIQAPTLLLWGDKDAMIPPANAQDYLRALPHARLLLLPGVGHLPQEEAPAAALPALRQFLAE
jgi:pimeloyl-ACP methyl ester carboxylesterase